VFILIEVAELVQKIVGGERAERVKADFGLQPPFTDKFCVVF
jgi:hypothetical protein